MDFYFAVCVVVLAFFGNKAGEQLYRYAAPRARNLTTTALVVLCFSATTGLFCLQNMNAPHYKGAFLVLLLLGSIAFGALSQFRSTNP